MDYFIFYQQLSSSKCSNAPGGVRLAAEEMKILNEDYNDLLLLLQSDGVQQTKFLARRYCDEAVRQISMLRPSAERDALIRVTEMVLTRDK